MLSPEEIKQKVEALEAEAARVCEPEAALYRDLAMKWRLVAVEAGFMKAIDGKLAVPKGSGL